MPEEGASLGGAPLPGRIGRSCGRGLGAWDLQVKAQGLELGHDAGQLVALGAEGSLDRPDPLLNGSDAYVNPRTDLADVGGSRGHRRLKPCYPVLKGHLGRRRSHAPSTRWRTRGGSIATGGVHAGQRAYIW